MGWQKSKCRTECHQDENSVINKLRSHTLNNTNRRKRNDVLSQLRDLQRKLRPLHDAQNVTDMRLLSKIYNYSCACILICQICRYYNVLPSQNSRMLHGYNITTTLLWIKKNEGTDLKCGNARKSERKQKAPQLQIIPIQRLLLYLHRCFGV